MASITIRNLDRDLKSELKIRAAKHGRSMEEEVRNILKSAIAQDDKEPENLADSIRERMAPFGGIELPDLQRDDIRKPADFS
ncbi:FitA-like ribbon-helix-helix domain-containing protein [Rhodohalobacter sp. 8-1]|uniref:FitA-like ribbon-helix-helix domain-containing protein n=1 Tax=Rhodohalobacter sp. 8-1 TaxID=3131972 RepID=UPI0030EC43DF